MKKKPHIAKIIFEIEIDGVQTRFPGNMNGLRGLMGMYIDAHGYLPYYVKPLAKEVIGSMIRAMSLALGNFELASRRVDAAIEERNEAISVEG